MKSYKNLLLFFCLFILLPAYAYSQEVLEYLGAITPKESKLLREPSSVVVEKDGRVIISDRDGNDLKFYYPLQDSFVKLKGDEKQKISKPGDVKVSPEGNIVVADTGNSRVLVLDRMGNLSFSFGSSGKDPGFFRYPEGVAIDKQGRIYVADTGNYRIQIFSKDGIFTKAFGKYGNKDGEFLSPTGVSIYQDKFIFVVDSKKNQVMKFDIEGNFISKFGQGGKGDGQFESPTKVDVDTNGNILVADPENYRIQRFTPDGKFISAIGSKGKGRGQFMEPRGIYIDTFDKIYVMDSQIKNIQIFKFTLPLAKKEEKGVMFNPPSTPKGLKLSYIDGEITVSWDKNADLDMDHYDIYRKDSKSDQLIEIGSIKETVYKDKNVKEGLSYTYGIKAVDAEKLSSPMSELKSVTAEIAGVTKKARVAVFTFKEASEKARAGGFGDAIAEFLTTSLVNLSYFDVVEREQLKKIIEEQSLSQTGALDSAQKIGEIMGVDIFIAGSVTQLGELIEIDSRMIDIITGKVITAQNVSAEGLQKVRESVKEMANKIVTNYHLQLGSLHGTVNPFDAEITIALESNGKLYTSSKANKENGRYNFSGLLAGAYQIKILSDKYEALSLPQGIAIVGGQRTELPEIKLTSKEAAKKPATETIPAQIQTPVTPPPPQEPAPAATAPAIAAPAPVEAPTAVAPSTPESEAAAPEEKKDESDKTEVKDEKQTEVKEEPAALETPEGEQQKP
jgi:fibronectin type 3 domain-containing protein/sugar lactone lactonase YvrE